MSIKSIYRFSILFIILVFSSLSASAATLTVSNTNDSGAGSLRQAVIDAVSGDTIIFSVTGTITLTSGEITINKNLTIIGPGAASLAIDGNNNSRIFQISSATVTISEMTFQNGIEVFGGAIRVASNGILTVNNSIFSDNVSSFIGGAISNSGRLTINNSRLSGNDSIQDGGAIFASDGILRINNSTLSGNSATGDDGGVIYMSDGTLTINNSTLSGNSAAGSGGAIYLSDGTLTINNSTLSGNSAAGSGGAIYNSFGTLTIRNSIVSGNTATSFGDECRLFFTFNADANNLFGTSGDNGGCTDGASDIVPAGAIGTILSGLANNGGPTQTHALVGGSPAIDASGAGATATDQRGVPAQSTRDIGVFESGANPTYPTVQFSSAGATYNESDGTVNINLTISGAVNFEAIAQVYVADTLTGDAISGLDYSAFPFTSLSIDCSSGTCPASISISLTVLTDAILENDEIANLEIFGTNGFATIGAQSTFAATIQDTTTSTIAANDAAASENPVDNGQFTVDLGAVNDTGVTITVNYSISGTATDGVDYTTLTGSVDIADGQQTATIDIVPLDDTDLEGDETVELTLTSTNNGSVTVDASPATVTIADDERPSGNATTTSNSNNPLPSIGVFDPAISKLGVLQVGQTGVQGEVLEWIVTVSNTSNVIGQNVVISDSLNPALRVDSVNAPNATVTINGQTVTVTYAVLNVGETQQFSIFTTVLNGALVDNTACVNAANQGAEECVTAFPVSQLPSTGENPMWRVWLVGLLAILVFGASGLLWRRGIGKRTS